MNDLWASMIIILAILACIYLIVVGRRNYFAPNKHDPINPYLKPVKQLLERRYKDPNGKDIQERKHRVVRYEAIWAIITGCIGLLLIVILAILLC